MKDSQEIMYTKRAAKYLSSIDLLRDYWPIIMAEECEHLTAFTTHNVFRFIRGSRYVPKGYKQFYQAHRSYAQAYIDDVIISSERWEEHIEHVRAVIDELKIRNFKIRLDKCKFGERLTKYLGHVIGGRTHAPDEENIEAIRDLQRPKAKRKVRSVLGLMGFYHSFIPNYAEVALPLTDLTKRKGKIFCYGIKGQIKTFNTLKDELCNITSLATLRVGVEYRLHADTSDLAVGCVLTQKDEKVQFKPTAFASQKLSTVQRSWSSIEK